MLSPVVNLSRAVSIADFRRMARKRLPRLVFDYIDGGAEDEITLRENSRAFEDSDAAAALRGRDAGL